MVVNLSKAKKQLSELVDMAYHGHKVTITKNNLPVVDLVPHKPSGTRNLGLLRGRLTVPDDFNATSDEFNTMFYGNER